MCAPWEHSSESVKGNSSAPRNYHISSLIIRAMQSVTVVNGKNGGNPLLLLMRGGVCSLPLESGLALWLTLASRVWQDGGVPILHIEGRPSKRACWFTLLGHRLYAKLYTSLLIFKRTKMMLLPCRQDWASLLEDERPWEVKAVLEQLATCHLTPDAWVSSTKISLVWPRAAELSPDPLQVAFQALAWVGLLCSNSWLSCFASPGAQLGAQS